MSRPVVSIIMGSSSDFRVMRSARDWLTREGVPCESRVISAHRTPLHMVRFAQGAARRGIKLIIAGAGGAAHLPGMVAALTELPVIGVPIALKGSTKGLKGLKGNDALFSIAQMPRGIPVLTVPIDASLEAAVNARTILHHLELL